MKPTIVTLFILGVAGSTLSWPQEYPTFKNVEDIDAPPPPGYSLVELVPVESLQRVPRAVRPQMPGEYQGRRGSGNRYSNRPASRPQIYAPPPAPFNNYNTDPYTASASSIKEPITAETGHGHGGHGHDYVDYGAYTGGWGAFGWYSDHPVGGGWGH